MHSDPESSVDVPAPVAPAPVAMAEPAMAEPEPVQAAAAVKAKKKRKRKTPPPLLFIDTNILLDFYRARNDAGISLLSKIDQLHDQTIITCQVEMEFKKNRQKVMSESVGLLKSPEFTLSTPAFLSDAATVRVIKRRIKDVSSRIEKLKGRVLATLENPKTHDRIFKTIQRLLNKKSSLSLQYDTPEYRQILRRALRRFLEGRPPRKKEDTSAGDAINWEWIVHCIQKTNRDVIIVSRDADYGLTHNGKGYANNWLSDEVKERVNKNRKLILVDRLSAALKLLDVKVTPAEVSSERATINCPVFAHENEIESLVGLALPQLLNNEALITSLMSVTNAYGWGCDGFVLDNLELKEGIWTAQLSFEFSGEHKDETQWCGDRITGSCIVEVDHLKTVTFSGLEAELSVEPEEVEPEEVEPEEVEPDEVEPDEVEPDEVEPDEDEPDEVEPDEVEPEEVEPDEVEPEEVEPEEVEPEEDEPEEDEPEEDEPEEVEPEEVEPEEDEPEEVEPEEVEPEEVEPEEDEPEEDEPEEDITHQHRP